MEIILVIFIFVIVVSFFKSPKGKGIIGEFFVKILLGKNKEGKKRIINNLTITGENGMSHQIDHVLINNKGIFVIETKNYSGRIYGNEKQLNWTQVLAYGRVKNKIYNPIKQNITHIFKLRKFVDKTTPFYSIIVFVKNNTSHISSEGVIGPFQLKREIKNKKSKVLTKKQIEKLYIKIIKLKKENKTSNRKHIKNINNMLDDINKNICPRCGATLLLRKTKQKSFYGCSTFPKCKFTKNQ